MIVIDVMPAAKKNGINMNSDNMHRDFVNKLTKDPVKLAEFMRKVMGPPHRTIEGDEKSEVELILALLVPYKETNNQHSWTYYYRVGDIEYHVTSFPGSHNEIIDEYLHEDT